MFRRLCRSALSLVTSCGTELKITLWIIALDALRYGDVSNLPVVSCPVDMDAIMWQRSLQLNFRPTQWTMVSLLRLYRGSGKLSYIPTALVCDMGAFQGYIVRYQILGPEAEAV